MGDYYGDLHYENLASCRLTLVGTAAASSGHPPVRLPASCLETLQSSSTCLRENPYDFSLEKNVLEQAQTQEQDQMIQSATSREELEKATLVKMKSVTGAKEDLCIAMLESNGYDLKTSIEAFYVDNSSRR